MNEIKRLDNNQLLLATSIDINANDFSSIKLVKENDELISDINVTWRSVIGQKFDTLWITNDEVPSNIKIILNGCEHVISDKNNLITFDFSDADTEKDSETLEILTQERETLKELIELNETALGSQAASNEEKKWTKLNLALISKTIDQSRESIDMIGQMFSELEDIDNKRRCYYADQRSRFLIEYHLKR